MDYISMQKKIVDQYFYSWIKYDTEMITQLFSNTSSYIILPRKRVLDGVTEIIAYWVRNSKRQKDLKLEWEVSNIALGHAFSDFSAHFYDIELNSNVHIHGTISFVFREQHILTLAEYYDKTYSHITCK